MLELRFSHQTGNVSMKIRTVVKRGYIIEFLVCHFLRANVERKHKVTH